MADKKESKTRVAKPIYAVMIVNDDNGNVVKLTKENVTVISCHKNADDLLEILEGDGLPEGAFYKRIAVA